MFKSYYGKNNDSPILNVKDKQILLVDILTHAKTNKCIHDYVSQTSNLNTIFESPRYIILLYIEAKIPIPEWFLKKYGFQIIYGDYALKCERLIMTKL